MEYMATNQELLWVISRFSEPSNGILSLMLRVCRPIIGYYGSHKGW